MRTQFNIKLFVVLVGAILILGVGVHFLHGFQVQRNAHTLRLQAERAEEKGNAERAIRFLGRYLAFVPTDVEALTKYGLMLDRAAPSPRGRIQAKAVYEKILLLDPQRQDARRRAAQLAIELRQVDEAIAHLKTLRQALPEDAEVLHLLGQCQAAKAQYKEAVVSFEAAIQHDPQHIDSYLLEALLQRKQLNDAAAADAVMDRLVEANPDSARARLARWQYRKAFGTSAKAEEDVTHALELAPEDVNVLLTAAEMAVAKGDADKARTYLVQAEAKHPRNVRVYQARARLEDTHQQPQEAIACLRRGLKVLPNQADLLESLAQILLESGQGEEAGAIIAQLRTMRVPAFRVVILEAVLAIRQGKFLEATAMLESIRPQAAEIPSYAIRCDLLLGRCYEQAGDLDQQVATYRRVVGLDPLSVPAQLGLAAALMKMGRTEEALGEYQRLANLPKPPANGLMVLARLLVQRTARLPAAQQQWGPAEQALDKAETMTPDRPEVPLLRAEMLTTRGQFAQARALLEKTRERFPKRREPWVALALLADIEGKPDAGNAVLDEAQRQLGDQVDLRLARLARALARPNAQTTAILEGVAAGNERFDPPERGRLLIGLIEADARLGRSEEARRLWYELAKLPPHDLARQLTLFDLALPLGDDAALRQTLDAIQELEGKEGVHWRCGRARYLIRQAQKGGPNQFAEAREQLGAAALRRPTWSQVPLLLGQIDDLEQKPKDALDHYQRAVELGERHPAVIRRLVQLLYERQRYAEADALLSRLQEQTFLSDDLRRLSVEVALRSADSGRALDLAQKTVRSDSKDYHDHLWLGHVYATAGRKAEAEAALRRALELAGDKPDPWVSLILFQVRTGQKDKAKATLAEAQRKIPAAQAALAWAQCCEILDQPEQADKIYREAVQSQPKNVGARHALADFLLRNGKLADAQAHLRTMLEPQLAAPPEERAWARRSLAKAIASENPRRLPEALALLEENQKGTGATWDDEQARALVLAADPGHRGEALALFEKVHKQQPLPPEQRFYVAQLYQVDRNWPKVRDWVLDALGADGGNSRYLTFYVQELLAHDETSQAETWLAKLRQVSPLVFDTVALEAQLLAMQGKGNEAKAVLDTYIQNAQAQPADVMARHEAVARLLDTFGRRFPKLRAVFNPAAESLYRQVTAQSQRPEAALAFAGYLARQQRLSEALDLCEAAGRTCPAERVAVTLYSVLHLAPIDAAQQGRIERWLAAALAKSPQSVALLVCLADLRDQQGRSPEAEELYRQALAREPTNILVLNNLGYLLAIRGVEPGQALAYIERAMHIGGMAPELLDTRAMVYLAQRRYDLAIKDLEAAVRMAPRGTLYYHLARAYWLAKTIPAATEAWQKAKAAGVDVLRLSKEERTAYQQLAYELDPK